MTQRPPPGEEEFFQLWEDEGFQALTSGDEEKLEAFMDELHAKLTPTQRTIVRTRMQIRFEALAPSLARVQKDNGGR
ncbi:MAG: hypothetical protein AAGH88_03275 [Planctomycetota bacterium]